MKKTYSAPVVELVKLESNDIIATSLIFDELGTGGQLARPTVVDEDEFWF